MKWGEWRSFTFVLAVALTIGGSGIAGCGPRPANQNLGELTLMLDGSPTAPFAVFAVSITRASDGKTILQRKIDVTGIAMPIEFVSVLPAGEPLVVDVEARDDGDNVVGVGGSVIELAPVEVTTVEIDVVAVPSGKVGAITGSLSERHLPHREGLLTDPAKNVPSGNQELVASLVDAETGNPVTSVRTLSWQAKAAPSIGFNQDGSITAGWDWPIITTFPAKASVSIAYLDDDGRGWIASARATFPDGTTPSTVDVGWTGIITASGTLAAGGTWALALTGLIGPSDLSGLVGPSDLSGLIGPSDAGAILYHDLNQDGDYDDAKETMFIDVAATGRIIPWTAGNTSGLVGPSDVAGVIADTDGDGTLDTVMALSSGGEITIAAWPVGP